MTIKSISSLFAYITEDLSRNVEENENSCLELLSSTFSLLSDLTNWVEIADGANSQIVECSSLLEFEFDSFFFKTKFPLITELSSPLLLLQVAYLRQATICIKFDRLMCDYCSSSSNYQQTFKSFYKTATFGNVLFQSILILKKTPNPPHICQSLCDSIRCVLNHLIVYVQSMSDSTIFSPIFLQSSIYQFESIRVDAVNVLWKSVSKITSALDENTHPEGCDISEERKRLYFEK
jgi:hypothetical protein